jgi:heme/copper-type cytochrome/quinol oxidase subunit 2
MKTFPSRLLAVFLLLCLASLTWATSAWASNSGEPPWWLFGFIVVFYCGIFLFVAAYYVFLVLALVDIARAQNEGNWKLLWALVSIFGHIIGLAVYYFVGRHDRIPPKPKVASV